MKHFHLGLDDGIAPPNICMEESVVAMIVMAIMMQNGDAYDKCLDWSEFMMLFILFILNASYTMILIIA